MISSDTMIHCGIPSYHETPLQLLPTNSDDACVSKYSSDINTLYYYKKKEEDKRIDISLSIVYQRLTA